MSGPGDTFFFFLSFVVKNYLLLVCGVCKLVYLAVVERGREGRVQGEFFLIVIIIYGVDGKDGDGECRRLRLPGAYDATEGLVGNLDCTGLY